MQRGIYEWELLAALLGLCLVIQYTRHAPVILLVDNQAAQAALISGSGKSELATQICAAFWSLSASAGINVWLECVPSKLNIPDAPSRACNVPRNDNEPTDSFENIPLPGSFLRRVQAPIHLPKARYGEEWCVSHGFPPPLCA